MDDRLHSPEVSLQRLAGFRHPTGIRFPRGSSAFILRAPSPVESTTR